MKKIYVLDTSVLLSDPDSLTNFSNNDIVIPFKVLEELDNQKKRQDVVGSSARRISRILDELREKGSLLEGVKYYDSKIKICQVKNEKTFKVADDEIIEVAKEVLETEKNSGSKRKVIVVSRDINMRIKCDALGILCENYLKEQLVDKADQIYTGFSKILIDDEIIDRFYANDSIFLAEKMDVSKFSPNQFLILVSDKNEKKSAIARFYNKEEKLGKVTDFTKGNKLAISPRNKEQTFALNLLMDQNLSLVSLIGIAGGGKSLLSLAAGLAQIEDKISPYKRLVIARPIQPMGKDLGFLPGNVQEKLSPWMKPIYDNLEFLTKGKEMLSLYMEKGNIEIEALTYIRGRTINDAFIILDEAQNLNPHELKTVITRVGENSKIVLTGDIEQIDNPYLNEVTNGLTYVVEKFRNEEISGHVTMMKGERSRIATLATKLL